MWEQVHAALLRPSLLVKGQATLETRAGQPDDELLNVQLKRLDHRLQQTDVERRRVVAGTARQAAEARGVLQRFGIGINEAENGVWLPKNLSVANSTGAYVHSILHTNEYYSSVNELLAQADTRQEAIESLSYIRQQLLGGALP